MYRAPDIPATIIFRKNFLNSSQNLARADAYWPTHEGLYNLEGTAAEMTSTKGIAMGGSFCQYACECTGDHQQTYSGPQDWLGFRYIVTLR
jgi:hypothetical protein